MGTNLSQVFISNIDVLETGTTFSGPASTPEIGIWNLDGNSGAGAYVNSALYQATADLTVSDTGETLTAIANPLWFYNNLQFVQGTAGNPIATPMINTRNIRRIAYDPFVASVGHTHVLTDAGSLTFTRDVRFKFIVRTTPTAQLNFHDAAGTGYVDLSGEGKEFPLGASNNTNHKAITVEVAGSEYTSFATLVDKLVERIEAHGILDDLLNITDNTTNATIVCRFAGVRVDLVITDGDGENIIASSGDAIADAITDSTVGVGNDWQVLSEEIRCRSRYGNFNRMYLPQNMATYTGSGYQYDRITIQYEHNWPTSTGIAPAGTLNEVVLYFTDSDGTAPVIGDAGTATYDDAFGITIATAAEFIW